MGEQSQIQPQPQPQSPPSASPPEQSQPNSDPPTVPSPNPIIDAPTTDINIARKSSNPSKIPVRPRQKIRKLSSESSPAISALVACVDSSGAFDYKPLQLTDSSSSPNPTLLSAPAVADPTNAPSVIGSTNGTTTNPSSTGASTPKFRRRSASQSSRVLPQIIRPLSAGGEIEAALRHLRAVDPLLATIIDNHPPPAFEAHSSPFLALAKSILYQQLAYKAGTSIYNRFVSLCGGDDAVRPENVLGLSAQQLKQIGVSGRKAGYLYDLANKYKSGILSDETVIKMDDRSLFTMLSMVKGIGSWSVHMFMIFSLHRPDVLPVSDLGVRKGVQLLYGLDDLPRPSQMVQMCEKWRPYRSVGSWYMWRFVDGKGVQSAGRATSLDASNVQPLQQIEPQQDSQQHQLQLVESMNGMGNLGAVIWSQ